MLSRILEVDSALDERYWRTGGVFAQPTLAGPKVEAEESMTIPAIFCALNLLSGLMAMLPLPVIRVTGPKSSEPKPDHPVHDLLNVEANPETTAFKFRQTQNYQTIVWGNCCPEIQRNGTDPVALWLNHPNQVKLERSTITKELVYTIERPDGDDTKLPARNVLHTSGIGLDGIVGYKLIDQLARENVGLAIAISEYEQSFFGNGTILGAMISWPNAVGKETRTEFRQQLGEVHGGSRKAFKMLMTDQGAKVEKLGVDNVSAQTFEMQTYSIQDVSRWTGVPPPFLAELSHATYTNIPELARWLAKFTLAPPCKNYEQEFTRKLFTPAERRNGYKVKYNLEGLLRGDPKEQAEIFEIYLRNGVYSINDVLFLKDMNGIGSMGDRRHVELNRTTLEDMAENGGGRRMGDRRRSEQAEELYSPDAMVDVRQAIGEAHKPLLADAYVRMVKIQSRAVKRAAKYQDTFAGWLETYYAEHALTFRDAMIPCVDALAGAIRSTLASTSLTAVWDQFVGTATKAFTEASIGDLQEGVGRYGVGYLENMLQPKYWTQESQNPVTRFVDELIEETVEKFGCIDSRGEALCTLSH